MLFYNMKFVDRAKVKVVAGHGGAGAVSFWREPFNPRGGPDGGDGGDGGNIIFRGDEGKSTLYDVRYKKTIKADDGKSGSGNNCYGRNGEDFIIIIPAGTVIKDAQTEELLADIVEHGQEYIAAHGGKGGRGNAKMKSSRNRAPKHAQPGLSGESREIMLELKLLADIGIIGFPSVGKSTFISVVSNAKPKVAEYPFTTLVPNLGMIEGKDFNPLVIADLPGLIEGAHTGQGLGHRFLKHAERTKILLHMVEISSYRESPVEDIVTLNNELRQYSSVLAGKEQITVLNKTDIYQSKEDSEKIEALRKFLGEKPLFEISAVTGNGVEKLLSFLKNKIHGIEKNQ